MLSNDFEHFLQGPIINEEVCNKQPLENKMNSRTWSRNRHEDGFATSEGLLVLQRQTYRAQKKGKEEEIERRRDGKAVLKSGQKWTCQLN